MKLRLALVLGLTLAGSLLMVGTEAGAMAKKPDMPKKGMEKKAAMGQKAYVCEGCHVLSAKAGECPKCQKKMDKMHLLGVKDGKAMLCACGASCTCDAKGVKDGKCACGKEVKKMKATGLYACAMGCPELSENPGTCACGMEMKKVE